MVDPPDFRTVQRRQASSGRVDYIAPIEIHDTTRSRIELLTWLIERSDGTEMALKLMRYDKKKGFGGLIPSAEINFNPAAGRRLLKALKEHEAIATHGRDASYIVISVEEGTVQVGEIDPSVVASAIAGILSEDEIVRHLADLDLSREMVTAFRGAIRLKELRTALASLRQYLDEGVGDEQVYQQWCEEHSWAFGNTYVVNDKIRAISRSDKVDLLLPRLLGGFRDLIELKRPDMKVLAWDGSHQNYFFASDVSKAIGQCHRYLDVLEEEARDGMRDAREVVAYHPRATIVIGRSVDWGDDQHRALHGLNARLAGMSVMTYDHLLAQGQRTLDVLSNPPEDEVIVSAWDDEPTEASDEPRDRDDRGDPWQYASDEEPF